MKIKTNELLTIKHLAIVLNISERTIYRHQLNGLPVVYIGRLARYNYTDVMNWFSKQSKGGKHE